MVISQLRNFCLLTYFVKQFIAKYGCSTIRQKQRRRDSSGKTRSNRRCGEIEETDSWDSAALLLRLATLVTAYKTQHERQRAPDDLSSSNLARDGVEIRDRRTSSARAS